MLFPTHRVVSGLSPELWERLPELLAERWELEEVPDVAALERRIVRPRGVRSFGLVRGDGEPPLHARLRGEPDGARRRRGRDARPGRHARARRRGGRDHRSHRLPPGCADDAAALVAAAPPRTAVALLVPAPSVADVEAVADAGQTMPPKSTFFFPKILDGMVFNQLDPFDP